MTRIFLTRHGETEGICAGRMEARLDSPLTTLGIKQGQSLALRLKEEELHSIYTSPSLRAAKTAEIIRGEREISLIKDEDLYEMDIGSWDGKTLDEIKRTDPIRFRTFREKPELYRREMEIGENFEDVQDRVSSFLTRIMNKHKNQTVLVVSHTAVLTLMMCQFKGKSIKHFWDPPMIQNASLSLIHVHNNEVSIELDADISHLQNIAII